MRLNFSGVGEDDIREGVRRIGEVVREQVELYGTLTGERRRAAAEPRRRRPTTRAGRRARAAAARARPRRARRRAMSRVAVLKGGRSLERQVSLRSGARVEDALERLGHDVVADRRRRTTSSRGCARRARTSRSSRCTARDGEDGTVQELLEMLGIPYTGSGVLGVHPLRRTRCWPSTCCATPGIPTPDFFAFNETAFKELGAAEALPAIEERLDVPDRRQAGRPGLGARDQVRRARRRRAGRARRRVLLRRARSCSSATSTGATSRSRCSTARAARCRSSRPCPRDEDFYDFEARYEIGRTDVRLPGRPAATTSPRGRRSSPLARLPAARLRRLRARRPHARRGDGRAVGARGQRGPGADRDVACCRRPPRRPGIAFDDARRADRSSWR